MYLRLLTVTTTDEITVGVVWADALRARVTIAQITRAFLIIVAEEMWADVAPHQLRGRAIFTDATGPQAQIISAFGMLRRCGTRVRATGSDLLTRMTARIMPAAQERRRVGMGRTLDVRSVRSSRFKGATFKEAVRRRKSPDECDCLGD